MESVDLASVDSFTYTPLSDTRKTIRLLRILPGQRDELLRCDLIEGIRESKYVCLSYEWGTDDPSNLILVNGCTMLVRNSLFAFLRQARKSSSMRRSLWVNAVCINHSDNDEKSYQVTDMFRTYASADTVFAWLGEGDKEVEECIDLVNDGEMLERRFYDDVVDDTPESLMRLGVEEADAQEQERLTEQVNYYLQALVALSYWTRLWTVQEIQSQREIHSLSTANAP